MFKKRGQVAMEFLMTYGWAILIILVAVAVLWMLGVFSPTAPSQCTVEAPFNCQDIALVEGGAVLKLAVSGSNLKANINSIKISERDCAVKQNSELTPNIVNTVYCVLNSPVEKGEKVTAEFDLSYKGTED